MGPIEISMSGLEVEWQRVQMVAQNLANINTTRNALGESYMPQRIVSGPDVSFEELLQQSSLSQREPVGVKVMGVEVENSSLRRVHDPSHPHADQDGFVTYPNIDRAKEMTLLIKSSRAYEANLAAIKVARQMYSSALDLGR